MTTPPAATPTLGRVGVARRLIGPDPRWPQRSRSWWHVRTWHPQLGWMYRGRIELLPKEPGDGARGRWTAVTFDHEWLEPVVGDYLDAELALLAATAGMDEVIPDWRREDNDDG